jgi:hypothetical protein
MSCRQYIYLMCDANQYVFQLFGFRAWNQLNELHGVFDTLIKFSTLTWKFLTFFVIAGLPTLIGTIGSIVISSGATYNESVFATAYLRHRYYETGYAFTPVKMAGRINILNKD